MDMFPIAILIAYLSFAKFRIIIRLKLYEDVGFKTVDENAEEYIMVREL